jgi:hypothetical protein
MMAMVLLRSMPIAEIAIAARRDSAGAARRLAAELDFLLRKA